MGNSIRTRSLSHFATIACLFLAACSQQQGDPIVEFEEDDAEMNAAVEEAQQTLDQFRAHLEANPEDETALIKAPINTGSQIEHIWVGEVQFDGQQISGVLANEPYDLSKYQQGDSVTVPTEDISDWAYFEEGEMRGGYTIKVMEKRMSQ